MASKKGKKGKKGRQPPPTPPASTEQTTAVQPEEKLVKIETNRSVPSGKVAEEPVSLYAKRKSDKTVKHAYPTENLNLPTQIEGTLKATEKAVLGVLADHGLKYRIPLETMAPMCKGLQAKIDKAASDPLSLDSIDAALVETVEDEFDVNEGEMREELIKYILIASCQPEKLSFGTMLSMVQDLGANGTKMLEHEIGYPAKLAPSVNKFYDLTEAEFESQTEQKKLKMTKEYLELGLRHHQDVADFLKDKQRGLEDCSDERLKELSEAFKRNQKMGDRLKNEYDLLRFKDEVNDSECRNAFRLHALQGKIGVRSKEDEEILEDLFERTPLELKKKMGKVGGDKKQLKVSDVPTKVTKAKSPEYQHSFIPPASIYLVDDYM